MLDGPEDAAVRIYVKAFRLENIDGLINGVLFQHHGPQHSFFQFRGLGGQLAGLHGGIH